jgi:hypothetical protein
MNIQPQPYVDPELFITQRFAEEEYLINRCGGLLDSGTIYELVDDLRHFLWRGKPISEDSILYISHFRPHRMALEYEAKKALMRRHEMRLVDRNPAKRMCSHCTILHDAHGDGGWEPWPCEDIRIMMSVWSDHPDYRKMMMSVGAIRAEDPVRPENPAQSRMKWNGSGVT